MNCLSCCRPNSEDYEDQRRLEIFTDAISYLELKLQVQYDSYISHGSFSDVVKLVYTRKSAPPVAAKIMISDKLRTEEYKLWTKLEHPRLVPVLDIVDISLTKKKKMVVYLMPFFPCNLGQFVSARRLETSSKALFLTKQWLKNILQGLQYLHKEGLCHLNIQTRNIYLNKNLEAVIGDFAFLKSCEIPTKKYGGPYYYFPPEASEGMLVEGTSCDIWCVGTIAVQIFSAHTTFIPAGMSQKHWHKYAYWEIYKTLRYTKFENTVKRTMRRAEGITGDTIEQIRNFIHMFLKINPRERPTAEKALEHEFLGEGSHTVMPDQVWTHPVSEEEMIEKIHQFEINNSLPASSQEDPDKTKESVETEIAPEEAKGRRVRFADHLNYLDDRGTHRSSVSIYNYILGEDLQSTNDTFLISHPQKSVSTNITTRIEHSDEEETELDPPSGQSRPADSFSEEEMIEKIHEFETNTTLPGSSQEDPDKTEESVEMKKDSEENILHKIHEIETNTTLPESSQEDPDKTEESVEVEKDSEENILHKIHEIETNTTLPESSQEDPDKTEESVEMEKDSEENILHKIHEIETNTTLPESSQEDPDKTEESVEMEKDSEENILHKIHEFETNTTLPESSQEDPDKTEESVEMEKDSEENILHKIHEIETNTTLPESSQEDPDKTEESVEMEKNSEEKITHEIHEFETNTTLPGSSQEDPDKIEESVEMEKANEEPTRHQERHPDKLNGSDEPEMYRSSSSICNNSLENDLQSAINTFSISPLQECASINMTTGIEPSNEQDTELDAPSSLPILTEPSITETRRKPIRKVIRDWFSKKTAQIRKMCCCRRSSRK